jgi:hypothetical protein
MTLTEKLAARDARDRQGNWYPASNGTETPFTTRTRRRLLYCWQPSTGRHAYLDCGTDMILTDEEAEQALAL